MRCTGITRGWTRDAAWKTQTFAGVYKKSYLDGFGRPTLVETGDTQIRNYVETRYIPCACTGLDPNGRGTTAYAYSTDTITTTDAKGNYKKFTRDVFGNLVKVAEKNPAGGADLLTTYTYTLRNQLATAVMTRGAPRKRAPSTTTRPPAASPAAPCPKAEPPRSPTTPPANLPPRPTPAAGLSAILTTARAGSHRKARTFTLTPAHASIPSPTAI